MSAKTMIVAGCVCAACVAGGVGVGMMMMSRSAPPAAVVEDEGPKRNVITQDNVQEVVDSWLNKPTVAPGYYEVKMNSQWYFEDGSKPSTNAYVENVVGNTHDVYFDVELADTGEVILQSPVIPRGAYMEHITLDKDLPAGKYDCVLIYYLVDEEQNVHSDLRMTVEIEVAH